MNSPDEVFYPTVAFGFSEEKLHQLWISTLGTLDWRPVPMVELGKVKRQEAIAGYVPEDDDA